MTTTVNMLEAKTSLPELVRQVGSGAQREIVIVRAGRPAARLVARGRSNMGLSWRRVAGTKTVPGPMNPPRLPGFAAAGRPA